jgi:hypothetical protein
MTTVKTQPTLFEELEISRLAFELWQDAGRPENELEAYRKKAVAAVLERRALTEKVESDSPTKAPYSRIYSARRRPSSATSSFW